MLDLINIYKTFEKGPNENQVLRGLSLHLERGELVTVIGSNGAGKTSLFNVIAGTVSCDEGRILLDRKDLSYEKEHRRARDIGRLFQNPHTGTAPGLSIEENLALVYSKATRRFPLAPAWGARERRYFTEALARLDMGLEHRLKTKAGSLSGGQRQALALLLAVMVPPKLLLLDEHTAALDPVAAKKILELTLELTREHHITTLMITHNISSALETGTRTIMMHKGKIVMDLQGEERKNMAVEELLHRYRDAVHENLDTDRILLGD
ncbi:MAG: ATP-binding cassette domain-containing protein [Spirochaetaceae bacterium]|jgi:putative ABC transport system ATP-binding protein|nr:ATP-binding cassette domain-containing protein [Spirochaetaceae bacterium]